MSIPFAVQVAVRDALAAALGAVPVFDHTPENQGYPFVEISRWISRPDDTFTDRVTEAQGTLTVWSAYRGQKEVLGILALCREALHEARLSVPGADVIRVRVDRDDTARDQDGATYMGSLIFTVTYQH